jgi:hypothetical protein
MTGFLRPRAQEISQQQTVNGERRTAHPLNAEGRRQLGSGLVNPSE